MVAYIPQEVFDVAVKITDYCRIVLNKSINPNTAFTLADHINFAIKRYQEKIDMSLPIIKDIEHLYENEYDVGLFGLKMIEKILNVKLPNIEAGMIALHIVNAEMTTVGNVDKKNEDMILDIVKIIEKYLNIKIDKNSSNYSRFVSHMNYLFIRGNKNKYIFSKNSEIYSSLVNSYPETNKVVERITIYLEDALRSALSNDEKLYLILHVNRLCTREDCENNQ